MEPIVSAGWLNKNLQDSDIVILDASQKKNQSGLRTELANIQIKGARFFDLENTFSDKCTHLPHMLPSAEAFETECRKLGLCRSSKIVVYDNLGIYFSPRVWWMFRTMGHENVSVLDGGLPAWVDKGFDTQPFEKYTPAAGDFETHFNPDLVKEADFIKDNLTTNTSIVIDARSEDRFNGIVPEPREGLRKGHIPGSVNIPFQLVLNNGFFKSKSELKGIFKKLEQEGQPLVFSCGSGVTACIDLLASELAGIKNQRSVYDGSWTEWGRPGNLPIECSNNV